jgi:hypothetical protein
MVGKEAPTISKYVQQVYLNIVRYILESSANNVMPTSHL